MYLQPSQSSVIRLLIVSIIDSLFFYLQLLFWIHDLICEFVLEKFLKIIIKSVYLMIFSKQIIGCLASQLVKDFKWK